MKIGEIVKYVYRKYTFKVKMKPEHGFIFEEMGSKRQLQDTSRNIYRDRDL